MNDIGPEWVAKFHKSILELDSAITEFGNQGQSLEDACAALVALNRAKSDFGLVYDELSNIVSRIMEDSPEVALPDGSRVEKKFSSSRTGRKHKDLGSAVAGRIVDMSVDMDTGEVLATPAEMIAQVLDFVQPSYWRIKELERLGINPDMYCQVGETKTSIIVRKGTL
jgi:hypothetical protein